jgi:hypothetical protein
MSKFVQNVPMRCIKEVIVCEEKSSGLKFKNIELKLDDGTKLKFQIVMSKAERWAENLNALGVKTPLF